MVTSQRMKYDFCGHLPVKIFLKVNGQACITFRIECSTFRPITPKMPAFIPEFFFFLHDMVCFCDWYTVILIAQSTLCQMENQKQRRATQLPNKCLLYICTLKFICYIKCHINNNLYIYVSMPPSDPSALTTIPNNYTRCICRFLYIYI